MKNTPFIFGAAFGFLGVALGAFGAHGLEDVLQANGRESTWDTAVLYQLVHVGLLLVVGILGRIQSAKTLGVVTWAAIVGILIFSGSLYLLSITNLKWLGAITPFGGVSFLVAWAAFLIYAFRNKIHS